MRTSREKRCHRRVMLVIALLAGRPSVAATTEPGDKATAVVLSVDNASLTARPVDPDAAWRTLTSAPASRRSEPERARPASRLRGFVTNRLLRVTQRGDAPRVPSAGANPPPVPTEANAAPPAIAQPGTPGAPEVTGVALPAPPGQAAGRPTPTVPPAPSGG
jgi:hypothetical protein